MLSPVLVRVVSSRSRARKTHHILHRVDVPSVEDAKQSAFQNGAGDCLNRHRPQAAVDVVPVKIRDNKPARLDLIN